MIDFLSLKEVKLYLDCFFVMSKLSEVIFPITFYLPILFKKCNVHPSTGDFRNALKN